MGTVLLTLALVMTVALQLDVPGASADSNRVRLENRRFSPERIDISVGDTVEWKAKDDGHTVTGRNGQFDSSRSGLLEEGDEFRWRFPTAGRYAYFCRVHGDEGMQGEVVVLESPAGRGAVASSTSTTSLRPASQAAATTSSSSTTTTTAQPSTTTTARVLATSSTVNLATTTTGPVVQPVAPQEPPTIDPDIETETGDPPEASLPPAQAALRRHRAADPGFPLGMGLILGLPMAIGVFVVWRRRHHHGGPN